MLAIPMDLSGSNCVGKAARPIFKTSNSVSFAAASGTYFVFYLYARFFKKIEHKLTFIVQNINFLIAALTGIVAASSLYKMFF